MRQLDARPAGHRLLGLLLACSACGSQPGPADDVAEGAQLFASTCARCHGAQGLGGVAQAGGAVSRNLADPAFQASRTDAALLAVIRDGKPPAMPAFAPVFDEAQLQSLVRFLRSLRSS